MCVFYEFIKGLLRSECTTKLGGSYNYTSVSKQNHKFLPDLHLAFATALEFIFIVQLGLCFRNTIFIMCFLTTQN